MKFPLRFSYLAIVSPLVLFAQSALALTISNSPTIGVTITTDDVKRVTTFTGTELNANVNRKAIEDALIGHDVVITDVREPDVTLAENTLLSWSSANALIINAHKDINLGYGAQIISNGYSNLILRADSTADNDGTIIPGGSGPALIMKGGGNLRIYYHPVDYAVPTDFSASIQLTAPATANAFMAINNFGDLQKVNRNLNGKYGLATNINANGARFSSIGTAVTPFTGFFDGQGFQVSNFSIYYPTLDNIGFFGYTKNATVQDISLFNIAVNGKDNVGGLIGFASATKVFNSSFSGEVFGDNQVGGLIGTVTGISSVDQAFVQGSVHLNYTIGGGLIGLIDSGTLINNFSANNSFSTASVSSDRGSTSYGTLGGLNGYNYTEQSFRNVYAAGLVTIAQLQGGLIGSGYARLKFFNAYWDKQTSKQNNASGGHSTLDGTTGLDTLQMKQRASYPNWDFINVWAIDEGVTYPYLRWTQKTAPWTLIYNEAKGYKIVG